MLLFIIIFIVILLFAPIFVTIYACYNKKENRLYFAIYSLKIIKILSGYITVRDKGGFYIHVNNTAYIINKDTLLNFKMSSGDEKAFLPLYLYLVVDSGSDFNSLSFLMVTNFLSNIFSNYLYNTDNYFDFNNDINIYNNESGILSIKLCFTLCFNLFCIVKAIFANHILKGVKNAKKWSR